MVTLMVLDCKETTTWANWAYGVLVLGTVTEHGLLGLPQATTGCTGRMGVVRRLQHTGKSCLPCQLLLARQQTHSEGGNVMCRVMSREQKGFA